MGDSGNMTEQEIKFMIDARKLEQYEYQLAKLMSSQRVLQVNHYYDSADFVLYELGNTLRIRQKEDSLKLQYKYDKKYIGIQKISKEYEVAIERLPKQICNNILPDYSGNKVHQYVYRGNLITDRWNFIHNKDVVSLDKNYYFGVYDCELEIEYGDYEFADFILRKLNLNKEDLNKNGKYSRFVEAYKRMMINES